MGLSKVYIQTAGPNSVRLGNVRLLIALHCPLLMLVSTPLRIVNAAVLVSV